MLTALKGQGRSTRYHLSSLKDGSHQRLIAFLLDSRLSSKHIYRRHHFLEPFRMLIPYRLSATDRIGTYVFVYIKFILNNRLRLRTFLRIDYQGTCHVPAIAYQENVSV